jgi:hypothetical protein
MGQRTDKLATKLTPVRKAVAEATAAYAEAERLLTEVEEREAREAARRGVR